MPKAIYNPRAYTAQEQAFIRETIGLGLSASYCAKYIGTGRTRCAIIAWARRNGLHFRSDSAGLGHRFKGF